uniref:Uncharacterized protein n=1 Tax=Sipha flava TaxID=143950 RepID=A0A2S2QE67_9HEMI
MYIISITATTTNDHFRIRSTPTIILFMFSFPTSGEQKLSTSRLLLLFLLLLFCFTGWRAMHTRMSLNAVFIWPVRNATPIFAHRLSTNRDDDWHASVPPPIT